ncbi:MAG: Ig-like domain-containing protein [Xanthomonadales bacterium]|nr:Ig-like domain-containing protein [Xanthomonadales bacterium]
MKKAFNIIEEGTMYLRNQAATLSGLRKIAASSIIGTAVFLWTTAAHSQTEALSPIQTGTRSTQLEIINDGPDPSEAGVGFVVRTKLSFDHSVPPTGTIEVTSRPGINGVQASCTIFLPEDHCILEPLAQGEIILLNASYSGDINYAASDSATESHSIAPSLFPKRATIGDGGLFSGESSSGGFSRVTSISADGRFTATIALEVDGDNQTQPQAILIYDRLTSSTENISAPLLAELPGFRPVFADISDDGRYVAAVFRQLSQNRQLVRLFDRQSGTVIDPLDGVIQTRSLFASEIRISGNGEWVVTRDLPQVIDGEVIEQPRGESLFLYRVEDGSLTSIPDINPADPTRVISDFDISTDGQMLAFATIASPMEPINDFELYTYELNNAEVSEPVISFQSSGLDDRIAELSLSGNKAFIFFVSESDTLVANDNNDSNDIFRFNLQSQALDIVSLNEQGQQLNRTVGIIQSNNAGNTITFLTAATNLPGITTNNPRLIALSRNLETNSIRPLQVDSAFEFTIGSSSSVLSSDDNSIVALTSEANITGIGQPGGRSTYLIDFNEQRIDHITPFTLGQQANAEPSQIKLINNGQSVAWNSVSSTLVSSENNDSLELFIRDLSSGITQAPIANENFDLVNYDITEDGRFSAAIRVLTGVGTENVVLVDHTNGNRILLNENELGVRARPGGAISISNDGNFIAWESEDSLLVDNDTNLNLDIYLHDQLQQTTQVISLDENGAQANDVSFEPLLSGDGNYVIFTSGSALVAEDTNGMSDVYRYHIPSASIERISVSSNQEQTIERNRGFGISIDGNLVLFSSFDNNLDNNNPGPQGQNLYVRNIEANNTIRIDTQDTVVESNNDVCLSPTGSHIAYTDGQNISIVNAATAQSTSLNAGNDVQLSTRCLSTSNHLVAFKSSSNQLVVGDNNLVADGFIAINSIENSQPIAQDDFYTLLEEQEIQIAYFEANSPIANDIDADNDPLVINGNSAGNSLPLLGGDLILSQAGTLLYFPENDQFGTETFTYSISDSVSSSSGSITISILPVNDAPSFTLLTKDIQAFTGSGLTTIENFAEFNPGAANEVDQSPTYSIQNTVNFDALSNFNLSTDGTLSFEFNPLSEDVTISFDLIVSDDGGTDNGGVDTSAAQQVTITLLQDAIFSSGFEASQ